MQTEEHGEVEQEERQEERAFRQHEAQKNLLRRRQVSSLPFESWSTCRPELSLGLREGHHLCLSQPPIAEPFFTLINLCYRKASSSHFIWTSLGHWWSVVWQGRTDQPLSAQEPQPWCILYFLTVCVFGNLQMAHKTRNWLCRSFWHLCRIFWAEINKIDLHPPRGLCFTDHLALTCSRESCSKGCKC